MRAKEFLYENDAAFTKGQYNVKWFPNEEDPGGVYIVFKDNEEIGRHEYQNRFKDLGQAFDAAKKQAVRTYSEEVAAANAEREHDTQMNKPLSEVEKRWVELDKRLVAAARGQGPALTDDELKKYSSYGQVVRKSLRNDTHPAMSHRKR